MVRRAERVLAEAVAASIGLDRTSVPMTEDRPADALAKPEPKRRRPQTRRPPAPYDIHWRVAYVGTVCLVDAHAEAFRTVRYAAAACDDPRDRVAKMTADFGGALKLRSTLLVGIMRDGAHEMWNRTREGLKTLQDNGQLETGHEGIDRYHLLERLAEALPMVEPRATDEERKNQLEHWSTLLDTTDDAIDCIEQFLVAGSGTVHAHERNRSIEAPPVTEDANSWAWSR
jgi:hypothetical protein